jgi:hypothetical protein
VPAELNNYGEDVFLSPDDEPPNRKPKRGRRRVARLQPLPGIFVRVPLQWLCNPCREHIFKPEGRLFLYLLHHSRWGQRGVMLTSAAAAEIGLSRYAMYRAIEQLERKGWVRVIRRPGCALEVWPIVPAA